VPTPRLRSLAEITRAAGWRTAAFVSAAPLKRGSGIESGFEHFDEPANAQRRGEETTAAALAWLAQQTSGRFLLWVHYYDAHFPYAPPPPFAMMFATDAELEARIEKLRVPRTVFRPLVEKVEETRASINAYDGELRYQDTQLGALLGALAARPDWERTAVVVLGDHGEGLGQHDEAAHGGTWNEQLHAPLVMRIPGEAPRREPALISAADVFPTLLGRLTLPAFAALLAQTSGRDVLSDGARSGVLSQDTGRLRETEGFRFALTTERWKLFEIESREGAPRHLLFDLEQDPFELRNVSERHPGVTQQLANELAATRVAKAQRGLALRKGETATSPADPRLREQLEALGYVDEEPSPR
jgi:arylsulfatase A-like enzyme